MRFACLLVRMMVGKQGRGEWERHREREGERERGIRESERGNKWDQRKYIYMYIFLKKERENTKETKEGGDNKWDNYREINERERGRDTDISVYVSLSPPLLSLALSLMLLQWDPLTCIPLISSSHFPFSLPLSVSLNVLFSILISGIPSLFLLSFPVSSVPISLPDSLHLIPHLWFFPTNHFQFICVYMYISFYPSVPIILSESADSVSISTSCSNSQMALLLILFSCFHVLTLTSRIPTQYLFICLPIYLSMYLLFILFSHPLSLSLHICAWTGEWISTRMCVCAFVCICVHFLPCPRSHWFQYISSFLSSLFLFLCLSLWTFSFLFSALAGRFCSSPLIVPFVLSLSIILCHFLSFVLKHCYMCIYMYVCLSTYVCVYIESRSLPLSLSLSLTYYHLSVRLLLVFSPSVCICQ